MLLERGELAALVSVSYSTIYKMEAQNHLPRLSTVKSVAKVLKMDPKDLLKQDALLAAAS